MPALTDPNPTFAPLSPVETPSSRKKTAAVRWAVDHGGAHGGDPQRIVLGGFSSGGYLATLLAGDPGYLQEAGAAPARIRAIFAVSGFFDLHHLSQSMRLWTMWSLGR